jgi:hypothetical protein
MEGRGKTRRLVDDVGRHNQHRANQHRDWPIKSLANNSGMRHRADRALVTRYGGVVRMYVDCLDETGERHQKRTQQD